MLKIIKASFLNRMKRPSHSDFWNASFSLILSDSSTFMSSIGGCQELSFLPVILYPPSVISTELIGHLQHNTKTREKGCEGRSKNQRRQKSKLIALISK